MSLHFSANQFEDAYAPQRLGNWQVPKNYQERPRIRLGASRTAADDNGHFASHSGRKNPNHHLRFQSAPIPKSNQLFISGSAVPTAKPSRATKTNAGQRSTAQTAEATSRKVQLPAGHEHDHREFEEEAEESDRQDAPAEPTESVDHNRLHLTKTPNLLSSSLPDNPRKAAIVLAARQKNHRPLPDLMLESRDILIPRHWNQPEATAVTVETTKAKGPTSCTKRTVVRLIPEGESVIERRPNVMELAIKWDVTSPPSSAGGTRKSKLAALNTKPVEKTLEWLYDQPVIHRSSSRPEIKRRPAANSSTNQAQRPPPPDNAMSSDRSKDDSARNHSCPLDNNQITAHRNANDLAGSEPESGYNSPRWTNHNGETNHKAALTELDEPVKNTYRSAVSSATPPKNHFLVSTSAFGSNKNDRNEPVMLPEYPLQRRSPVHHSATSKTLPAQESRKVHPQHFQLNEYPPQHMESTTSAHYRPREPQAHQSDRDSGVGDLHDQNEDEEEEYEDGDPEDELNPPTGELRRSRSRPCLACHTPPGSNKPNRSKNGTKAPYKQAMKAGIPSAKNHVDLEKVIQRRQSYRAPKPAPLSSHARHIRGTLAPPLSAGVGNEPIVDYPDFKRLDSTYRLSYGAHTLHHPRRRPKTLTAILNEKNCRQWRS